MKRALALSTALLLSCVSGNKIRADSEVIKADVERAKKSGAMRCAPRELATAEANLDFALGELAQGTSTRAAQHITEADKAVKAAIELSKECGPKQVLVKEEKMVLRIEETDTDGDGILDTVDKCPDQPEDKDNFQDEDGCPDPDNDADGILDAQDKCPDQAEDKDEFQDDDGCPEPDNDNDTILDPQDQCPNEAGKPENNGCPDKDGDGLIDKVDKCPDEPGPKEEEGCPKKYKLVVVKKDKIEIKQQIKFKTGSAKIVGGTSFEILDEVAQALRDNPQIKKIRVEGHTDSVGSDSTNLKLSQKRADSVMSELVKRNIDPSRMEAVGYGETQPIASNSTTTGRAENRRTEFNVVEQ